MIYLTMAASLIMTDSANNGGGGAVCAQERDEIQSITCSRCRHNPIAAYTRHSVLHQTAARTRLSSARLDSAVELQTKFSQCPEEALVEHSSQGSKLKGHLNIASRQIFEADLNVKALVGSFNVTIKPSRTFVSSSTQHPSPSPAQHSPTANCCAVTVVEDQMIRSVSDLKNLSAHFQGNIRNGEKWGEARKNSNKEQ